MPKEPLFTYLSQPTADAIAHAAQLFAEDLLRAIASNVASLPNDTSVENTKHIDKREIWGVEEAAAHCGVEPRTIRLWVSEYKRTGIPFFRPPNTRRLRFNAVAFKAWFSSSPPSPKR